jgi:hypothetical protein
MVSQGPVVSGHRLRDGWFLGHLDAESTILDSHEVHIFRSFDPNQTLHILLAGNRIFNLTNYSGQVEPRFVQRLQPLVSELRHRHATFSLVVLEQTMTELRMLHANAFPGVHHYRHIEPDVHQALVDYLVP